MEAQTASFKNAWPANQQQDVTPAVSNPNPQPNHAGPKLCSALGTANKQSNGQRISTLNLELLPQ